MRVLTDDMTRTAARNAWHVIAPLVRAQALEEAARVWEEVSYSNDCDVLEGERTAIALAARIRALKGER